MSEIIPKELEFDDVFILPQLSSINDIKIERTFKFINNIIEDEHDITSKQSIKKWTGIPIVLGNNSSFENYNSLKSFNIVIPLNISYKLDDYIHAVSNGIIFDPDYFMVSTGISDEDFKNLKEILLYTNCKWINIDVENGHSENFIKFCIKIRHTYPEKIIVAGNVLTGEMVHTLITKAGVDIIKVGINNNLNKKTGIGRPAFSAIKECSDICRSFRELGFKVYTLSEFEINCPGDLSKSFGAGSDFVMIQNSGDELSYLLDCLRSSCQYIGAECIEDFPEKVNFVCK